MKSSRRLRRSPFLRRLSELTLAKGVVVVGGLVLLVLSLPRVSSQFELVAFFVVCAAIASLLDVHLPQGGAISVDSAVIIASIVLLPLPETVLVVAGGTLIAAVIKRSWFDRGGIGFLVAAKLVTTTAASMVFYALHGEPGKVDPVRGFAVLIIMCATYFFFEIAMEELSKLKRKVPSLSALISSAKFLLPLYLTFASLGILLALLYGSMGPWSALFFFLPLAVTRHSFKLYLNIRKVYSNTITALANAIEAQNPERHGHVERVAELSANVAREMGLHGHELELISYAALLHDIGMIGIEERADECVDHAGVGAEIVEQVEFIKEAADMVRLHHASFDSSIAPLGARIIGVASAFDDLVNDPALEERLNKAQAFGRLKRDQGIVYDPKVVRALGSVLRKRDALASL